MSSQSSEHFVRACGLSRPPELIALPAGVDAAAPARLEFPGPFAVIGRDPRADVTIDDPRLGRRHCYLQAIGSAVYAVNLSGDEGEAVGRWFRVGPEMIMGRHGVGVRTEPLAAPSPETEGAPGIALEIRSEGVRGVWTIRRTIALVGSGRGCRARLNSSTVSPYHCSFVKTGDGLWVVDLLADLDSAAHRRVVLNGEPVRFARVDVGDVLQIGEFRVLAVDCMKDQVRQDTADVPRSASRARGETESLRDEVRRLRDEVRELRQRGSLGTAFPERTDADGPASRRPLGVALRREPRTGQGLAFPSRLGAASRAKPSLPPSLPSDRGGFGPTPEPQPAHSAFA